MAIGCAGMMLLSPGITSASASIDYTNRNQDTPLTWWGTGKAETYDVAVLVKGGQFTGLDIEKISFPAVTDPEVTDFKIWMSESLTLENKENHPDVSTTDVTVTDGIVTASLSEPYRLTEGGVYVGLSFTVNQRTTPEQQQPLATIATTDDSSLFSYYIHSSRTYAKWGEFNQSMAFQLPFTITLSNIPENAAALSLSKTATSGVGLPTTVNATITNYGIKPITSLTVSYEGAGLTGSTEVQLPESSTPAFTESAAFSFEIPAINEKTKTGLKATITGVNGQPNSVANATAETQLKIFSHLPENRPLLEEYTGTGCGYCPRGSIGIEKMRSLYGERFIAVAHHCDDSMAIFAANERPNLAPAQPVAWINRNRETDPYFGDDKSLTAFGIDKVWESIAQSFTPADITLQCQWADDTQSAIEATANVTFVDDYPSSDMRVAYMLVADGLQKPTWFQGNYYSGATDKWPADFAELVAAPQYIVGLEYDDVVILAESSKGIPGSLPSDIKADETMTHTGTLTLANAKSLAHGENLVQDKSRLSVVAVVIDASTGSILNSAKASFIQAGVEAVTADAEAVATTYHDIMGRTVTADHKGITIKTTIYSNGDMKSEKFMNR